MRSRKLALGLVLCSLINGSGQAQDRNEPQESRFVSKLTLEERMLSMTFIGLVSEYKITEVTAANAVLLKQKFPGSFRMMRFHVT